MKLVAGFLLAFSTQVYASTPVDQVDKINKAREGNLAQLVLDYSKKNFKSACDVSIGQLEKFEVIQLSGGSNNQEKTPGTPYDYEATYLVLQKCLFGSTFVGAYADTAKATAVQASFHSFYNKKGGPAKMEDLQISAAKEIDVSLHQD